MLVELVPLTGTVIAELGVGLGHLSQFILDKLRPREFAAIDTFQLHTLPSVWDQSTSELFGRLSHRNYYERKFAGYGAVLNIYEGDSHDCLARFPDQYFDLIYIDADHTYEGVKRDATQAVEKLRPEGTLVFNDYVLFDHGGNPYGVVPAVNELLAGGGWQIVAFAFQALMYCDIALRRGTAVEPSRPAQAQLLMQERIRTLETEVTVLRNSTSWRITRPLRALGRLRRGGLATTPAPSSPLPAGLGTEKAPPASNR
jgi:hypothetical protein